MRAVLDANVLISAAISEGPSHRIVHGWLQGQTYELVICDRSLGEVRSVLTERPRLRKWISLESAELYVRMLATVADVQPDPALGPALTQDLDDEYVITGVRVLSGALQNPCTSRAFALDGSLYH